MASKTITIKTGVYEQLSGIKGRSESFSALFQRLLREKQPDLLKFAGAWKLTSEEDRRLREAMESERCRVQKDWEQRGTK
ncbi:antitoxin VapB family protein [Candidatus Woesearchaeota archaeon]|nr:antitoxin VapB family protein [Candidatus Woesearchaeota archaeon]